MAPSEHNPRRRGSFTVSDLQAGYRLDQVLAEEVKGWSRSRLQKLIREQSVRVGGELVEKPGTLLARGTRVEVEFPCAPRPAAPVESTPLSVLYQDEQLIVIDKPAGMVTHPNQKFQTGTVADLAVAQFGPLPQIQGEDRPGIVHRLDKETSGALILGRDARTLEELKRQFKAREVEKTYLCICHGDPRFDSDWIESRIASTPRHPDRMSIVRDESRGREASTFFQVRERFHGFAYVSCSPKTGRTHQIRVHLASIGLPILGDKVYRRGGAVAVPYPKEAPDIGRQALHAHALRFTHPLTGAKISVESPLPHVFELALEWLRENRPRQG